ncbi:RHS repeat-associated core domain-containing protein [Desulfovibrio subterraneus]|uniref:RHS repeat domain-containing protein n=1 Tax=Desulfovibrio subterraneus TaxID=2718620 RepID=UPI0022B8E698|nr:RHS repeat-associated core domain-containing protein [Desulfovibrio subterraneus]WBF69234.1 RHS repeat-associated core domain-containing protein [Desulfovibrio subterraneus]
MHTAGQNQMFVEGRAALLSGGQTGQWGAGAKNRTVERPHYGPEIHLTMGENGKLREKLETIGGRQYRYAYSYDASGRLATVHLNNRLVEVYHYNGLGQRIRDWHAGRGTERRFFYAPDGQLQSAGDVRFFHDAAGSLRCRQQGRVNLYCFYEDDTRLDAVRLPDGTQMTYCYGASLGPVASFLNGEPAESFVWLDSTRLATYHDHIRGLSYHFQYGAERLPEAVTVMENLGEVSIQSAGSEMATYLLGYDQVGSLRAVWSQSGELIKEIVYDSFGNVLSDSNEWFYMPIGFAGGLPDRYTGFVRFGYRDYDPAVGRFTARDPLGDTGGDHDLWDYCVDDPVNANDPLGLKSEEVQDKTQDPRGRDYTSSTNKELNKVAGVVLGQGKFLDAVGIRNPVQAMTERLAVEVNNRAWGRNSTLEEVVPYLRKEKRPLRERGIEAYDVIPSEFERMQRANESTRHTPNGVKNVSPQDAPSVRSIPYPEGIRHAPPPAAADIESRKWNRGR